MKDVTFNNLDSDQKTAAEYDGTSIIFSTAGSGKTTTLVHKIANMLNRNFDRIDPEWIVVITFTNAAANEIKERLIDMCGEDAKLITVGTFHSTCAKLIRELQDEFGDQIPIKKNFSIFDESDTFECLREVQVKFKFDEDLKEAANAIGNYKIGLLKDLGEFAKWYGKYNEVLEENNALDFNDLLLKIKEYMENDTMVSDEVYGFDLTPKHLLQNRWSYIFVDEFQDTNPIQYEITKHLASGCYHNLTVVGDDDQSIYAFQGATPDCIRNFTKDFPRAKEFFLKTNYRCPYQVVDLSSKIVKGNNNRVDKPIEPFDQEKKQSVFRKRCRNDYDENEFIANSIKKEIENGYSYDDIAILSRTNFNLKMLKANLEKNEIPCKINSIIPFFSRLEVKSLLQHLKVLDNPYNKIEFKNLCTKQVKGIGAKSVDKLFEDNQWNVMDVLSNNRSDSKAGIIFDELHDHFTELQKIDDLKELLEAVLNSDLFKDFLNRQKNAEDRFSIIERLIEVVESELPNVNGLTDFLHYAELSTTEGVKDVISDAVNLSTVHQAKGLEWPIVYIIGVEEGQFPHYNSAHADKEIETENIEEECRLLFVAMTRAKEKLIMTYCDRRRDAKCKISPFLNRILRK